MSQNSLITYKEPRCLTCTYVMPSETASTGLRCGLKYFKSTVIVMKFQLMHRYPEVKESHACNSWTSQAMQGVWNSESSTPANHFSAEY